jgi:hypothetical protein
MKFNICLPHIQQFSYKRSIWPTQRKELFLYNFFSVYYNLKKCVCILSLEAETIIVQLHIIQEYCKGMLLTNISPPQPLCSLLTVLPLLCLCVIPLSGDI